MIFCKHYLKGWCLFLLYKTNLKKLRIKHKLTMRQLEELTGISKSCISKIENNETDLLVSTLVILAKFFEVKLDDLIKF